MPSTRPSGVRRSLRNIVTCRLRGHPPCSPGSWCPRCGKPAPLDYMALVREAGYCRDRSVSLAREATIAAHLGDFDRCDRLNAKHQVVVDRLEAIAREIGAIG